jgi:DNA-binding transcriptional MerR regulator
MQPGKKEWKLPDLADEVGVSPRTVRYYVQRGLLPAPVFRGKDTVYGDDHVVRLKAIRRLQEKFLPLDAIQAELERASAAELTKIAEGSGVQVASPAPVSSRVPRVPAPPDRWERHELAPGVELHVRDQGDARRFARKLLETLGHAGGGDEDE